jgi:hypothetical protein
VRWGGRGPGDAILAVAGLVFIAWIALVNVRSIRNAFRIRFDANGVTRRTRSEEEVVRWNEVKRLRIDASAIRLQLESGRQVAISLTHAWRPDEVREAICAAVPRRCTPRATRGEVDEIAARIEGLC